MVSVQSSWAIGGPVATNGISRRAWQRSSGPICPPLYSRLPPDGHEFPPQFGESVKPPSNNNLEKSPCVRSRSASSNDLNLPPKTKFVNPPMRQTKSDCTCSTSTLKLNGRSVKGRISVRDKIALFSSQSVEYLASKNEKLSKQNSLNLDKVAYNLKSQCNQRSKSDLKLKSNDTPKTFWRTSASMKSQHSSNGTYGSLNDVYIENNGVKNDIYPNDEIHRTVLRTSRSSVDHILANTCARSRATNLSERSQSLIQLPGGTMDKNHRLSNCRGTSTRLASTLDVSHKVSLNSISEEHRRSMPKLGRLVIPDKVDGPTKLGPADLPTIRSCSQNPSESNQNTSSRTAVDEKSDVKSVKREHNNKALSLPPWKVDSAILPKYSPAFKRKNVSLCASFGTLNTSDKCAVMHTKVIGGSSLALNEFIKPHESRYSRNNCKYVTAAGEPLQRSSSLNSRPVNSNIRISRKVSDEYIASSYDDGNACQEEVSSSTLTLVGEVALGESSGSEKHANLQSCESNETHPCNVDGELPDSHCKMTVNLYVTDKDGKSSSNASTVIQHSEINHLCRKELKHNNIDHFIDKNNTSQKILEDTSWLRTMNNGKIDTHKTHCVPRLKNKPSVRLLAEKWQKLSATKHDINILSSKYHELNNACDKHTSTTNKRAQHSNNAISASNFPHSSDDTPYNHRTKAPLSGLSRKLSTPVRGSEEVRLRRDSHRQMSSLIRPHSLIGIDSQAARTAVAPSPLPRADLDAYLMNMNEVFTGSALDVSSAHHDHSPATIMACNGDSNSSMLDLLMSSNSKQLPVDARHVLSVTDLRQAFERTTSAATNVQALHSHARMSSLDSNTSEDGLFFSQLVGGLVTASSNSVNSLVSSTRDHYGSITSLASSTSLISPHELQLLIEDANQSLEESGTPSHEIIVVVLHREVVGGSIGVTLAGGADYDSSEISVNKVIGGSVADRDGRIKKGDRVLSINGRSMKGLSHKEALSTLKAPRAEVVVVLSRSRSVTPLEPTSADDVGGSSVGCQRPPFINHFGQRPPKILESPQDRRSTDSEEEFNDVPRAPASIIVLNKEGAGVGFSLQGGKDSPLGDRPLVAKKIFTGGAADKSGVLSVGDQIVAINDNPVTHMARIEAWNFLKKQPDGLIRLTIRKQLAVSCEEDPRTATPAPSGDANNHSTNCIKSAGDYVSDHQTTPSGGVLPAEDSSADDNFGSVISKIDTVNQSMSHVDASHVKTVLNQA